MKKEGNLLPYKVDARDLDALEELICSCRHNKADVVQSSDVQTERLILRPWYDSDAEDLYEYAKDQRTWLDGEYRSSCQSLI